MFDGQEMAIFGRFGNCEKGSFTPEYLTHSLDQSSDSLAQDSAGLLYATHCLAVLFLGAFDLLCGHAEHFLGKFISVASIVECHDGNCQLIRIRRSPFATVCG